MRIFGLKIIPLFYKDFFEEITKNIEKEKQKIVFTPNPEMLLQSRKDKALFKNLKKANYLTSDGIGLYIAYQINSFPIKWFLGIVLNFLLLPYYFLNIIFRKKYLYKKYGDRICWSDLTIDLVKFSEKNNILITILDLYNPKDRDKIGSQKNFYQKIKKYFPKLQLEYYIYNPEKKTEIIQKISKSKSKILFSTLGMEKQEKSVVEIMKKCKNIKLWLWVGSSFDYVTGFQKRAPKIMRNIGIEWLYRIFTSPNKIQRLRRILDAIIIFPCIVLFKNK